MLCLYCFLHLKPMEPDYIITIFIPFIWESQYMRKAKMASKSFLGGHFCIKSKQNINEKCQACSFYMAHHQFIIDQVKIYFKQGGDHYSFSIRLWTQLYLWFIILNLTDNEKFSCSC